MMTENIDNIGKTTRVVVCQSLATNSFSCKKYLGRAHKIYILDGLGVDCVCRGDLARW